MAVGPVTPQANSRGLAGPSLRNPASKCRSEAAQRVGIGHQGGIGMASTKDAPLQTSQMERSHGWRGKLIFIPFGHSARGCPGSHPVEMKRG